MKKGIIILCCLIPVMAFAISCQSPAEKKNIIKTDTVVPDSVTSNSETVSLISLIATPEKYNQKRIRVIGYFNLEFEGNALYLSKEDYTLGIDKNGLWIDRENIKIASKDYIRCNKQYVILEGTFQTDDKGHEDSYSGSITKITRIEPWKR